VRYLQEVVIVKLYLKPLELDASGINEFLICKMESRGLRNQ